MMTHDDARTAARHILTGYGPQHLERLRALRSGDQPWTEIDSEMGPVYGPTDASGRLTVRRQGLIHSYGGGLSPIMSALTPLGRDVVDLADEPG